MIDGNKQGITKTFSRVSHALTTTVYYASTSVVNINVLPASLISTEPFLERTCE